VVSIPIHHSHTGTRFGGVFALCASCACSIAHFPFLENNENNKNNDNNKHGDDDDDQHESSQKQTNAIKMDERWARLARGALVVIVVAPVCVMAGKTRAGSPHAPAWTGQIKSNQPNRLVAVLE
jgi:hypothetical protein